MSNEEILSDLKRVAEELQKSHLTQRDYRIHGQYSTTAVKDRFDTWNLAIESAGLKPATKRNIPDDELFDNLREVWIKLGRQPRNHEMVRPFSRYTRGPYIRRFGGWLNAMHTFVQSIDQSAHTDTPSTDSPDIKRSPRGPSLRLRFLVMRRDSFKCRVCGRSPATDAAVQLHIDHINPWSHGGHTTIENLQTLCSKCNLGKSDLNSSGG